MIEEWGLVQGTEVCLYWVTYLKGIFKASVHLSVMWTSYSKHLAWALTHLFWLLYNHYLEKKHTHIPMGHKSNSFQKRRESFVLNEILTEITMVTKRIWILCKILYNMAPDQIKNTWSFVCIVCADKKCCCSNVWTEAKRWLCAIATKQHSMFCNYCMPIGFPV